MVLEFKYLNKKEKEIVGRKEVGAIFLVYGVL